MKYTSRADLLIAAGESIKMQTAAGIDPVFKSNHGIEKMENVGFTLDPDRYEFPLAVVEGKPVFVGDELWHDHYGKCVAISHKSPFKGNEAYCAPDNAACFSWLPPNPKTVLVELLREDAEWMVRAYDGCNSKAGRIAESCSKALEKE